MVLLDSNIISEMLKPHPDTTAHACFAKQMVLGISVVSLDEVLFGLQRKRMLSETCIVPLDEPITRCAAELRLDFSQRGIVRTQADMMIDATALVRECTLATHNTKDFAGCGLRLIDPFVTIT